MVVATFHWGVERATAEDARQRAFAQVALDAGADAVIGAHPHVLQPIRRAGARRLVAYSLGNFVFGASSPATRADRHPAAQALGPRGRGTPPRAGRHRGVAAAASADGGQRGVGEGSAAISAATSRAARR